MGLLKSRTKAWEEIIQNFVGLFKTSDLLTSLIPTACFTHFVGLCLHTPWKQRGLPGPGRTANLDNEQRCALESSVTEMEWLLFSWKQIKAEQIPRISTTWNRCLNIVFPFFFTSGIFHFSDIKSIDMSSEYFLNERINCGLFCWQSHTLSEVDTPPQEGLLSHLAKSVFKSFLLLSPVGSTGSEQKAVRRDL